MSIVRHIEQLLCSHPRSQQIRRVQGSRLYLECTKCGRESKGIEYGRELCHKSQSL